MTKQFLEVLASQCVITSEACLGTYLGTNQDQELNKKRR